MGSATDLGPELSADCSRCAGLCCVAPAFSLSADFALDKAAGVACPNLRADFRCGIHADLRALGFAGCTTYDCFGAGQQVTQVTFGGESWERDPDVAARMFAVFGVVRQLHELLWYVSAAQALPASDSLRGELAAAFAETVRLTRLPQRDLVALDVGPHRDAVNELLVQVSELARDGLSGADHRGGDLVGADLRGADLRGGNLRGARLVGADLRGCDLTLTDVTGADLRGAQLAGTDLEACLFLTQAQLDAAHGDETTGVPDARVRPSHWRSPTS